MKDMLIEADLFRYGGLTGMRGFIKGWCYPGFRYSYLYRMTVKYKKHSLRGVFFRILKRRARIKYGYEIDSNAKIGKGLYISSHPGHIIIGPVTIGENCNINHAVTIGRSYRFGKVGRPSIDDNVWVGTGAVVVGDIKIGKNVLIAPNSFVNFDVPDNSLVIGNPAKIIPKPDPTQNYINHILCAV